MKYIDINRKFTEAVSSYIAKGYIINTASMAGHQGEVARIDLTNGQQVIRILLDSFTEWNDDLPMDGLKLVVGIATDNVKPNDDERRDTIWNNRLEVISCEKFYKLNNVYADAKFYGTEDEAKAANEKRFNRYKNKSHSSSMEDITDKAAPVVKEYIREKFGVRRVKMEDIKVTKHKGVFTVTYHKHVAQLH